MPSRKWADSMNAKQKIMTLAIILGVSVSELQAAHEAFLADLKQEQK